MKRDESGLGLLETVVSITLAGMMVMSTAFVLDAGLRQARVAKQRQQAISIGARALEKVRDSSYESIAMLASDIVGDPLIAPNATFDPDGGGSLSAEPVISTVSGAAVSPHVSSEAIGQESYRIARYVTWADSTAQGGGDLDVKRLSIVVTWTTGSRTYTYRTSTLITNARRGLPLPKFELTPVTQSLVAQPGATVVFAHTILNLGIVDTYDLFLPPPVGRGWVAVFFHDVNGNGAYDAGVDAALTDTNANGIVDTGSVETNHMISVLSVWTLQPSEEPGVVANTLTAVSGANPAVAKTATITLEVASPGLKLWLHNKPSPPVGDTTAQTAMSMDATAPSGATLYKYSTNLYSSFSGRFVDKSIPLANQSGATYMANWVYQVPGSSVYSGNASLKLWVAQKDLKCDKPVQLRLYLRHKASSATSTGTLISQTDVTSSGTGPEPCNFRLLEASLPMSATIAANRWIELKVVVNDLTGDAALLAYDTTAWNSSITLPQAVIG